MVESPELVVDVKEDKQVPVTESRPESENVPVVEEPKQGDAMNLEYAIEIASQQWATIQQGLIERFDQELRTVSNRIDKLKAEYDAAVRERNRIIDASRRIQKIEVKF